MKKIQIHYDCDPMTVVDLIEKVLIDCKINYKRIEPNEGDDGPIEFEYEEAFEC